MSMLNMKKTIDPVALAPGMDTSALLWPIKDQWDSSGSPGRPADSAKDAADKKRHRQLKRHHSRRSMAPSAPVIRSSAPSSQAPQMAAPTAFS